VLKVCSLVGGKLRMMQAVANKFDGTPQEESWAFLLNDHTSKFGHPVALDAAAAAPVDLQSGPDFSCDLENPKNVTALVAPATVALSGVEDKPHSNWRGCSPGKRVGSLSLWVDTAGKIFLSVPAGTQLYILGACELAGFNTGSFAKADRAALPAAAIAWLIQNDATLLVHVEKLADGTVKKTLTSVAQLVHSVFVRWGIPMVGLDCHTMVPVAGADGQPAPHFRFTVAPSSHVHIFKPDELHVDKLKDGGHMALKHGELGAVLVENQGLRSQAGLCGVVWEVEVDRSPPCMIKPLKPKLWLLGAAQVEPGLVYEVF